MAQHVNTSRLSCAQTPHSRMFARRANYELRDICSAICSSLPIHSYVRAWAGGLMTEDRERVLCRGEPLKDIVREGAEIMVRSWTVHVTDQVFSRIHFDPGDSPTGEIGGAHCPKPARAAIRACTECLPLICANALKHASQGASPFFPVHFRHLGATEDGDGATFVHACVQII